MEITDQNKPARNAEKNGSEYFVKKVDEFAAAAYVKARQRHTFNAFADDKARVKMFIKKLRGNSKKYYSKVLANAQSRCEICGWDVKFCLHIHHILPIFKYSKIFLKNEIMPDKAFELSNLIALCPNCHEMVHEYSRAVLNGKTGMENSNTPYQQITLHTLTQDIHKPGYFEMFEAVTSSSLFYERWELNKKTIFDEVEND